MRRDSITIARYFLQYGLAFVFLYVAVAGFIAPSNWVGFIPSWLSGFGDPIMMLYGHLVLDAVTGMWLVINVKPRWAAILASINLVGIIAVNLSALDIIFRDVGLLCMAIALAYIGKR